MFIRLYVPPMTLLSVVVSILNFDIGHGTTAIDICLTQQLSADEHRDILVKTFHMVVFQSL
jgi:hypothetical protein